MTRIDRIEALQRQLAELRAGVVQLQGTADDMYRRLRNLEVEVAELVGAAANSAPPVSPMITGFSAQRSAENGHSGSTAIDVCRTVRRTSDYCDAAAENACTSAVTMPADGGKSQKQVLPLIAEESQKQPWAGHGCLNGDDHV